MNINMAKIEEWFLAVQNGEEFPDVTDSDLSDEELKWLLTATQEAAARKVGVSIEAVTVSDMRLQ